MPTCSPRPRWRLSYPRVSSTSCLPTGTTARRWCDTPLVDKISFTGSSATGRRVGVLCAEQFKRVTLECGGKSPAIILDDAALDSVVPALMPFAIMMSGQLSGANPDPGAAPALPRDR
jgi:acyl-CoA reductase-like NAD-dependent aldehyde dehydrogenase